MIKQTMFYNGDVLDCATVEANHNCSPMFKAYDTEEQATEQAEAWRDLIGQNIVRVHTQA